ncbi:24063_t:CDS:2 [Entrophospora sp. SA101]|nr:24063_t:CDS:2 [Entrophospora sp. SA101]
MLLFALFIFYGELYDLQSGTGSIRAVLGRMRGHSWSTFLTVSLRKISISKRPINDYARSGDGISSRILVIITPFESAQPY